MGGGGWQLSVLPLLGWQGVKECMVTDGSVTAEKLLFCAQALVRTTKPIVRVSKEPTTRWNFGILNLESCTFSFMRGYGSSYGCLNADAVLW